jgi:hypothetical protein
MIFSSTLHSFWEKTNIRVERLSMLDLEERYQKFVLLKKLLIDIFNEIFIPKSESNPENASGHYINEVIENYIQQYLP